MSRDIEARIARVLDQLESEDLTFEQAQLLWDRVDRLQQLDRQQQLQQA